MPEKLGLEKAQKLIRDDAIWIIIRVLDNGDVWVSDLEALSNGDYSCCFEVKKEFFQRYKFSGNPLELIRITVVDDNKNFKTSRIRLVEESQKVKVQFISAVRNLETCFKHQVVDGVERK